MHLTAKRKIIADKGFCTCNKPCWKRLIMAVPYSYGPCPFKDSAPRQRNVQHTEVPLTIVAEGVGFLCHNEPATSELIMDFSKYTAVGQWVPCISVPWRGHFPQLFPAD
ncbi:MAG: hypothetical protein EBS01_06060 [Verrucomicrobia bacterium]|nr:hypothetical protein [Verrucomicrobiota bacterium]